MLLDKRGSHMNGLTENKVQTTTRPEGPVTVIIVDDEREICEALQVVFSNTGDIEVLAVGYSGEDAIRLAAEYNPQVILLDLQFPSGMDGIEVIRHISADPTISSRILVYTILGKESVIFEAIKEGASSYVWKDEKHTDLIEAVLATARGEAYASPKVAQMVLEFFEKASRFLGNVNELGSNDIKSDEDQGPNS
jgi:DNA-binding NarL/FixJ family response regulator